MAPSWLAWCSFSLRASNRLHFSTTLRLGCGGGLILAGTSMRSPQPGALLWDPAQAVYRGQKASLVRLGLRHWGQPDGLHPLGATSNRCPGLTTHLQGLSATSRGLRELYSRRALGGAIPVAFPLPVMTPILRAGGAISPPVLPCLVPGLLRVPAPSDADSEVLQLCHTPSRSCQVWERFWTGSSSLGAARRRPWGVAQKPVPSCLALRRFWSSPWVRLRLPSGRYRDLGSLALAASPTCVLSSLGPASGPKLSWISVDMA